MYFIETSLDKKKWTKIVDYSKYPCRSQQNLYFKPVIAKYIRIMGTFTSLGKVYQLLRKNCNYK